MTERTLASRTVFQGRALRLDVVDVELPDGRRSVREIVRHPGAVVVLARRTDGRFVLVRQYRKAIEEVLLEVVAGTLEPGEDPASAARRELAEESGYAANTLEFLGVIVPCPGYSEERLHLFFAEVDASPGSLSPDDDEQLATVVMSAHEIDAAIAAGALKDAKSLAIWSLAQRRIGRRAEIAVPTP